MRIIVDLQACQSGSRLGGIGRYSMNLAEAMIRQCGQHELVFILNNLFPDTIPEIVQKLSKTISKKQMRVFNIPGPLNESNPTNNFRIRTAELMREKFIFNLKPDIIFISSLIEGLGDDVVTSVGHLFGGETTSVTLYDLIPLAEKEKYLQNPISAKHYFTKIEEMKRAGSLLAISEFSRLQAIEMLNVNPDIVSTISSAIDDKFKPMSFSNDEILQVHKHYGIVRKFLLFAGSFDQRKNHEGLIKAFARLPREVRSAYQLVIIGNGWDGIYNHLYYVAEKEGLCKQDVIFTGHAPDRYLLVIYNTANLFVFPSFSEGFGLPVLEAMSCGIPTIGSNTTSIPEVIGLTDALFDPHDIGSITIKMHQALTDQSFRSFLSNHGLEYSKKFSWDASAKKSIAAFEALHVKTKKYFISDMDLIDQKTIQGISEIIKMNDPVQSTDIVKIASAINANNMASQSIDLEQKIAWVTTWNTQCGIALYSKYLGDVHASEYMILAPYENNTFEADTKNVIRCWHVGSDDFKEMTNAIYDSCITTIVIQFNYGFFDFSMLKLFIQEMVAQGRMIYITLHSTTDNNEKKLEEIIPAFSLCEKVIVHSKNDLENLRLLNLTDNVILFPQGIVDVKPLKIDLALPKNSFVLASYGFFLPHKGFLELIDTCKVLLDKGLDIYLVMVNAQYPAEISRVLIEQARQKIISYDMTNRVILIPEFLSDEESLGYLANANLIVYPYQETGESSSAAVRMGIASERLVAVTPLKIFDDVKNEVMSLSSTDVADMANDITILREKFLENDIQIKQTIKNADIWKQDHSYKQLGEKFWKILTKI